MFEGFQTLDVEVEDVTIRLRKGGKGPPLLLLHGYPQTHVMWHRIAPELARTFTVVAADLRGYGDSSKPPSDPKHVTYCKRTVAFDQVRVMEKLGFRRFFLCGHDRGARVAHRLALDHADRVMKVAVLDIVPTYEVFRSVNKEVATAYYHWFFLIQPDGLPERMIGADPEFYLRRKVSHWGTKSGGFHPDAMAEYIRCFKDPKTIHGSCEDYRAGASVDLVHDEADMERKIECPLLALWGENGLVHRAYDVLACWRERAVDVQGKALPCGHFLPEEAPKETLAELTAFFSA